MESLVEVEDFPGRLLHVAALWDNAELLEDLLNGEELRCLNAIDSLGRTALHAAATNPGSKCLRIMVQAGAKVDMVCGAKGEGRTALHIASEHGHVDNVRLLLDAGANLLVRDTIGLTALDLAEKAEHSQVMDMLQEAAKEKEEARSETHKLLQDACVTGDIGAVRSILAEIGDDPATIESVVNHAASGSNTLLFKSSEFGHKDLVVLLLENGADGRIHPVTKYSPLYIAAYNGKKEVVEILLRKFPELIRTLTVERWSALHASCINGHTPIFEYILKLPFKRELHRTLRDKSGQWEYDVCVDINQRDVTGQTLLYLATCVGNQKIVDMLLAYKVRARRREPSPMKKGVSRDDQGELVLSRRRVTPPSTATSSPSKAASGIQALISKLRGSSSSSMSSLGSDDDLLSEGERWLTPVELDTYCNGGTETALHNSVKRRELAICNKLLAAGADPNLVIYATENTPQPLDEQFYFKGSTCLVEACKNRDMPIIDLLLKYSAKDEDCKALFVAVHSKDDVIVSKLLSLKANQDPENVLNKKGLAEYNHSFAKGLASVGSLAYSSIFPSTSVMINWHQQGCLQVVKERYLVDAAVRLNPKLKLSPKFQFSAVHAITRLDLSNNELIEVPECLWSMQSLKFLSLAQNKIESLPAAIHRKIGLSSLRSSRKDTLYVCPWLEEIQMQDNRLDQLPAALFGLKSMHTLDVSNNKLSVLPIEVWTAPTLKELNLSFNLLSELPVPNSAASDMSSECSTHDSLSDTMSYDSGDLPPSDSEADLSGVASERLSEEERRNRLEKATLEHRSIWSGSVEVLDKPSVDEREAAEGENGEKRKPAMVALNLAHNSFSVVPKCLSCLCPGLARLNLAYNSIAKVGPVSAFPNSLKHLDLSYNQIDSWPGDSPLSGGQLEATSICYAIGAADLKASNSSIDLMHPQQKKFSRIHTLGSTKLSSCINLGCSHKKHSRLENLRTLILSNNNLSAINFYSPAGEGSLATLSSTGSYEDLCYEATPTSTSGPPPASPGGRKGSQIRPAILFPALSMLDVNNNQIGEIPSCIHDLVNLSVLNVGGNARITTMPPQMGLLYKLWNLNTSGCNLTEPLLTMTNSKSYKTSDIIGYLRSILENSKPYARLKLMVVGIQGIGKTTLLELLRQEGGSFKRRSTEHWAKRMGNKNINMKTGRGVSMSTVGVDIGDWTYEKKAERGAAPSHGPVVFRTWDFGGQTEYYATHQYFLSKRSLYLVLWKITDGEKGMNEIQQWLINIQARAPNSPVVIVGTHYDVVRDEFPPSFSEYLQTRIRERFINISDPEKCGLPRVLDSLEISCRTKHNIKPLAHLLYDTAFSLRGAGGGSKARLLEQKIPATYLALEELVATVAADLKSQGADPVLNQDQFVETVNSELERRHGLKFRDNAELNQATKFLHENGILLHYDDATLRDLYFLDPQWLCDVLSHVVTVREINPFARNGIMRLEDLRHVFKSSAAVSVTAKSYIVNLLNKFEVALTWDSRTLLIPSLLPTEAQMRSGLPGMDMKVKIAVRTRGWGFRSRRQMGPPVTAALSAVAATEKANARSRSVPSRALLKDRTKLISKPIPMDNNTGGTSSQSSNSEYEMSRRSESEHSIHRLLLMSYFPSGFWSRLLTRILADDSVVEIVRSYFIIPDEIAQDPILAKIFVEQKPEWGCWKTGLELRYMDSTLFSLKQVLGRTVTSAATAHAHHDYQSMRMVLFQEESWAEVDTRQSAILEVMLPQDTVVIKRPVREGDRSEPIGYQALSLDPNPRSVCQLLALAVEHIDTLLEDWYPSLGTRFLHTSEGRMLVTRLVPCPRCLTAQGEREVGKSWQDWSFVPEAVAAAAQRERKSTDTAPPRVSQDSTHSDRDSGVGQESPQGSVSRLAQVQEEASNTNSDKVFAFLVEQCILNAFEGKNPVCPSHGDLFLGQIAPDTVFLDLDERLRVASESVKLGELIGRGAFGFVYESAFKQRAAPMGQQQLQQRIRNVAVKMLQPIDPGPNARPSTDAAYKASRSKWERDPLQYASKSYTTARQELNILIHLKHPHIVPLVGICSNPLSIVLELAPEGALDTKLKHYKRSGAQLAAKTVQLVVLQIARALEYLHQHHIIYRDLKSENVLAWRMPEPFCQSNDVHVKLADYGISRPTLPTGAKGFGGTEGFMAPEIVRYNGEEEYTEKVDSFSFGMFIYELLTLHQPFAGFETVKELILEGGRPPLTYRELVYPTYVLDLMVVCWAQQPRDRPSASQMVSLASAPEFAHLVDAVAMDYGTCYASTVVPSSATKASTELWMTCRSAFDDKGPQLHVLEVGALGWQDHSTLKESLTSGPSVVPTSSSSSTLSHSVTSMCLVNDAVWFGDNLGYVHAYNSNTYEKLFSYKMEPDELEDASPVRSIHFLSEVQRACVAMHNGRMFLCCADVVPLSQEGCEGTFLITELGSASCIHSVTSIKKKECVEIWCGESHGAISVFTLHDGVVTSQEVINHADPPMDNVEVLQVLSRGGEQQQQQGGLGWGKGTKQQQASVWTFVYPGCHIYQWATDEERKIKNKLDCSKLVPSSESLKTIAIDEHFSLGRCQIASMCIQEGKLYVGTSWGCLIVADAETMRPVSVFRPYAEEIQALIPLHEPCPRTSGDSTPRPFLISLGKGYRSLIRRFVSDKSRKAANKSRRTSKQQQRKESAASDEQEYDGAMAALLWRPDDWLCD